MISSLTGTINFKNLRGIEVLAGQVGYWVLVPANLIADWEIGEKITLYTIMIASEKAVDLYGFSSRNQVRIFNMLTSVSGVGPRTALQIFNNHEGEEIEIAIDKADVAFFQGIKGIGKKTAQRLIVDLRSVLDQDRVREEKEAESKEPTVYQALIQLGFSKEEIRLVINKVSPDQEEEEKIAQALKLLSGND
ncbi:MAG: Holliday junction branch migration protein RuvA [Candidatus Shapirobacteria bacterium]|nr:Holliday junction branch migration protein RuvA [Candidatus Shapirobacteria bacterium]MDD5073832.1 Holliday junction branch migration protein RuvA [Candidatus Shapirobacteria bacterium]MDD5481822.1 Holliday junction branch migration protein RuvA [Candidatus Shapirobacteria bacterium]